MGHIRVASDSTMAAGCCVVLDGVKVVYAGSLSASVPFIRGDRVLVLNPVDYAQCKNDYTKLIN
jgi:hypothetical protein